MKTRIAKSAPNPDRLQTRWMMGLRRLGGAPLQLALLVPLLSAIVLVFQAHVLAGVLGRAVSGGEGLTTLAPSIAIIGGLLALRAGLAVVGEKAGIAAAEAIKLRLRNTLFAIAMAREPGWTAQKSSGALSAALVDQIEAFDGFFAKFYPAMIQATLLPLAFAAVLFPVDWVVGLLLLLTAPLIPLFMALVGWGAQAATDAQADAFSRLSGHFADRLRGLLTLKLFGRAEAEVAAVRTASEDLRGRTMRVLRIAFLSSAVLEFFAALGVAGVALYIGLSYLGYVHLRADPLTLEAGLFCLLMAPEVYQPLRLLAAHYHDRAGAKAAVATIAAQFDGLPEIGVPEVPRRCVSSKPLGGHAMVSVRGLSIAVPGRSAPILDHVTFDVAMGQHIAILGPSGAGKSSFLETLARLRGQRGTIMLGGENLEMIAEADLRRRLAFISQRPRLFAGSLADNIRLGRRDASDADVADAARRAVVDEFTDALPLRLETPIGDGGLGLSGGEAHRVALARLYLRNPDIILLDEPTAHLDTATESRVLDGLKSFAKGRTLIMATHSDAAAARTGSIYRIGHGRLRATARPVDRKTEELA